MQIITKVLSLKQNEIVEYPEDWTLDHIEWSPEMGMLYVIIYKIQS